MPEKIKTRIRNGQKQYLLKFKCGLIDFVNDEERKSLALSYETLKEASENGLLRLPRSTMIVGDGVYNGYWHPDSELAKSYAMFDRQPWNVNHGDDVNSEIGWWEQPQKNGNKYSAIPILNLNTPEGKNALSHIQNRMLAGKPAELSIGFWCGVKTERVKHGDIDQRLPVCYDIEPDHCSLVTRGACSPAVGAGIGLKQLEEEGIQMDEKPENVTDAQKTVEQKDADTKTKQPIQFNSKEEFQGAVHQSLASYFQKQKQEDEEEDEKALLEKRLKELESQNQGFQKNMEDMQKVLKSGEKPTRKTLSMAQYMQMEKPKQSNSLKKTGVLYMNHVKQCIMAGTKPQGMYYREKFNEEYGCYTGQLQQINRGLLGQEFHTYDTAGPDIDTWDTDKLPPEMWAGSIFEDMVTKQKLLKYVLRRYDSPRKVTVPVKVWADATWTSTRGRDVRSNADDQDYSAQGIALDPTRYRTMAKIYRDSLEEATWNVEADVRERLRIATVERLQPLLAGRFGLCQVREARGQTGGTHGGEDGHRPHQCRPRRHQSRAPGRPRELRVAAPGCPVRTLCLLRHHREIPGRSHRRR